MWLCHVPSTPTDKNRNRHRNSKDETVDHRFLGSLVTSTGRKIPWRRVLNRAWLGGLVQTVQKLVSHSPVSGVV